MPEAAKFPLVAVTGSQQPYIFDLPLLLSLPVGFEFRFRYRPAWIESGLRELISFPGNFVGRAVILHFHSQETQSIIPIRRAEIISIESIGPLILLRFRVGSFSSVDLDLASYRFPKDLTARASQITSAAQLLMERARLTLGKIGRVDDFDLSKPLPDGWYLREAVRAIDEKEWETNDATGAWARIVAVLHTEPKLVGVPFFHVLGFRKETGDVVNPSVIKNRFNPGKETIHGFILSEFERYRMRVLEWCERPDKAPPPRIRLQCDFDKSLLALEGARDLIVGRYDVVEHTFTAQHAGYGEVALRAESLPTTPSSSRLVAIGAERAGAAAIPPGAAESIPTVAAAASSEATASAAAASSPSGEWPWMHWPEIFVARVPIVVKTAARRFVFASITLAVGFSLYVWGAPEIEDKWRRPFELFALGIMFLGFRPIADHLERFLKLEGAAQKLRDGAAKKDPP